MTCRTGCATKDHTSWGECAQSIQIGNLTGESAVRDRAFDADMHAYKRLRKDGVELPEVAGSAVKEATANTVEQMAVRL